MMHKTFYDSAIYIYMFLLVGCCLVTLYPSFGPVTVGFLALLWGLLGTGIILWMLEGVQDHHKTSSSSRKSERLPDALIYKMRRQNSYSRGVRATKAFAMHNIYVLVALGMYMGWGVWVTIDPVISPVLNDLNSQILYVFEKRDGFSSSGYNFIPLMDVILRNILPLLVLTLIFWLGQVFGHSSRAGEVMVWLCFGMFVIFSALLFMFTTPVPRLLSTDLWYGYGWGRSAVLQALEVIPRGDLSALQRRYFTLGMPGVVLGYLPATIVMMTLLRNAFAKASSKIKIMAGLLALCALLFIDVLYPIGSMALGVNFAGWSALAFLCIRGRTNVRRIYRLYQ